MKLSSMRLKVGLSILLALTATSCSLFSRGKRPEGEVRDIPFQARSTNQLRKRIMVLPFLNSDVKRSQKVADVARMSVVRSIHRTGQFVIVRNSDFPKDLSKYVSNQEYDLESIAKIAAGMGVAAVLEGRVQEISVRKLGDPVGIFRNIKVGVQTTVRIRLFSTKNGKEVLNQDRSATEESSTVRIGDHDLDQIVLQEEPQLVDQVVTKAFAQMVPHIVRVVEKLSWEGRVALVSGEKIYINAGRLSGIQVGDLLKVTEESEEVFDPETGLLIGEVPGRMKGTLEVISYFGQDGAIAVVHSGSAFKENDRVELY